MGLHHHHGHSHGHHHGHGHSHSHGHSAGVNRRRVGWAALLTGLFMIAEVVGGLISGSLALLADAGHMMTDFAALAMAWAAFTIARRPASPHYTFGYDRIAILAAFINGLTLFLVAGWIVWEAVKRFQEPSAILAGPMLAVAIGGLIVNIVVFKILTGADQENLNIRGAVLHVLGDLLGSAAAILAALIIMTTGWMPIDPILSVLVAMLILRSAWRLVKASAHVLMEGTPAHFKEADLRSALTQKIDGLVEVKNIKAWMMTPERPMITLTAIVMDRADVESVRDAIKTYLLSEHHFENVTAEIQKQSLAKST